MSINNRSAIAENKRLRRENRELKEKVEFMTKVLKDATEKIKNTMRGTS